MQLDGAVLGKEPLPDRSAAEHAVAAIEKSQLQVCACGPDLLPVCAKAMLMGIVPVRVRWVSQYPWHVVCAVCACMHLPDQQSDRADGLLCMICSLLPDFAKRMPDKITFITLDT